MQAHASTAFARHCKHSIRTPLQVTSTGNLGKSSNIHIPSLKQRFEEKYLTPCACSKLQSIRLTAPRTRCTMSISVDVPGYGHFNLPVTASSTAADVMLLLRERLPDCPWHGNKVLSYEVYQLQCDDSVQAANQNTLVFMNYSEISNKDTHKCAMFPDFQNELQKWQNP